jgi:hypothetical protein
VRSGSACLTVLLSCGALATAAGNVRAGRSYLGSIGGGTMGLSTYAGSPIQLSVSSDGKRATNIAAVYDTCRPVGFFGQEQVSFPDATVAGGVFKTAVKNNTSRSYATITIKGHFLPGGRVTGTIAGATNISDNPGHAEPPCSATNPWSAKLKPRGSGVCKPVALADANADFIAFVHSSCEVVRKTIRKGYQGQGSFSAPPGWRCHRVKIKIDRHFAGLGASGHECTRPHERFQFVIV